MSEVLQDLPTWRATECMGITVQQFVELWAQQPKAVAYLTAKHGSKQLCVELALDIGARYGEGYEYLAALDTELALLEASAWTATPKGKRGSAIA